LSIDDLNNIIPGPDFPTGRHHPSPGGHPLAYHLGRGSIVMRRQGSIDTIRKESRGESSSRNPYQVNKATMVERIAETGVARRRIRGVPTCATKSDRDGFASWSS